MIKYVCLMIAVIIWTAGTCKAAAENEQDTAVIVRGNGEFAFDLYARLKDKPGNLFFSPYSISTALAMTYAGAGGSTKDQMAATLHFTTSIPEAQFHKLFGQLVEMLNKQGQKGDYQLFAANALWLQKDYQFLPVYLKQVKSSYDAAFEDVDFIKETEPARRKINQWVEEKTNQKIKDLIPKDALDAMTRLVLTNAIYFKGDWAVQFPKDNTKDTPFYINKNDTLNVPMMYHKEKFKFADCGEVLLLELPYQGQSLSMLVLLPKKVDGIGELEKTLSAEQVRLWQKKMFRREVMVYLPRFKMTSEFALADTLKDMGMTDAFSDAADFSGMAKTDPLFISAVVHKAFVEVNEKGTEAAAATGITVGLTAMPAPPPMFCADHPFIFMIQDNSTNSILFIGRVADPTQTGE
jgi:serpin B